MRLTDPLAAYLLEQFPVAAVVLGRDGSVQLANSAAADMLERRDLLFIDTEGRLQLRCAQSQRRLMLALGEDGADDGKSHSSFLTGSNGSATHLTVVARSGADEAVPARLMTVVSMSDMPALDAGLLRSLYGLSPAEAKVAACLGLGQDVTTTAVQLGTKPATVRAQLKAVFRKLQINRQQDLVRIATLLRMYCARD